MQRPKLKVDKALLEMKEPPHLVGNGLLERDLGTYSLSVVRSMRTGSSSAFRVAGGSA
jgi:hypothetical protein